jgi:hypothetical protein
MNCSEMIEKGGIDIAVKTAQFAGITTPAKPAAQTV